MSDGAFWIPTDGGRSESGFRGDAGDCVTRAIAIAAELPYLEVYHELAGRQALLGNSRSARNGVLPKVYKPYLAELGFTWEATMSIGSGCQVHVTPAELPAHGRHILRLSGHLAAWIDGMLLDTHDCSREGTRCVYGLWGLP